MRYFKKCQLFAVFALSLGTSYGQSVVIDAGGVRVDASPTKAAVTTHGASNKRSKAGATQGDSDAAVVGGGSKTASTNVRAGGKVFVNTDFSGHDLHNTNYAGASFTNVEAVGTNLRGVDLSKASMTNVDLSKADLRDANLAGAQMTNVDWDGALLDGAIWVDGRRCGPGSIGRCK